MSIQLYSGGFSGTDGTFSNGRQDPYALINRPGSNAWCRTRTISSNNNPVWDKQCNEIEFGKDTDTDPSKRNEKVVTFQAWDSDSGWNGGDDKLLEAKYSFAQLRERCTKTMDWEKPWNWGRWEAWYANAVLQGTCACT